MSKEKNGKIWFDVTAKSVIVTDSYMDDIPPPMSGLADRIVPQGSNYHFRRDFLLNDADWVIYGVASTNDVDLVDDIVNAEEVFSESLEEFVNTGRIFWEHGYKLAGKVEADNPITAPIGVPYLAEIHNNELSLYVVLDKSHPTSQMVWDRVNQLDTRFNKGIGMSIGALPQGKATSYRDPITGNYVKKCPKMRLYEVSVTGQPINPYTWTEVVKSFLADELSEETMKKKGKAVTKALEDELQVDETAVPETPAVVEDDTVVEEGAMPEADLAGGDALGDEAVDLSMGGDEGGADLMGDALGGADEGMGMEGELGEGDDGGMLDLLGDDPTDDEGSDIADDVIHDKIDMLTSQIAEILEILNAESDAMGVEDALETEGGLELEETPAPEGEELPDNDLDTVAEDEDEDEDDNIEALTKSMHEQADRAELIFEAVKQIPALVKSVTALHERLDSMESAGTVTKSAVTPVETKPAADITAERENYEATTKSMKSAGKTTAVSTGVDTGGKHPGLESTEIEGVRVSGGDDGEAIIKSVLGNNKQVDLLAELINSYNSLYGTPVQVSERKMEIYNMAHEAFGMNRSTFLKAISMVKGLEN